MTSTRLPQLAFGERVARRVDRASDAAAQSTATVSSLKKYEPKGGETDFRGKISNLLLRDLALHANASEPVRAEMAPSDGLFFIMTLHGVCRTEVEGRKYEVVPNHKALLLTERQVRYGESETRSILVARLDPMRLSETARAMRGDRPGSGAPRPEETSARAINLRFGAVDHAASMRSVLGVIDSHLDNPAVLDALGLDDLLYRQIALMTWPDLFLDASERVPNSRSFSVLDDLCELIRSRSGRLLTITEMEKFTGLSGRTLQYAFNKRFGCSPMEWQRRERLRLAHVRLTAGDEPINIAALSAQLGFSSPSRFARYYKSMFGACPSERKR